jgi:hypothetical protein
MLGGGCPRTFGYDLVQASAQVWGSVPEVLRRLSIEFSQARSGHYGTRNQNKRKTEVLPVVLLQGRDIV